MKIAAQEVGPEGFPESEHIYPFEFTLVPDEQHTEEEEKVCRVGALEVEVEVRIHQLDKVIECEELGTHAGLIAQKVTLLRILRSGVAHGILN